jgi:hypothetical protein
MTLSIVARLLPLALSSRNAFDALSRIVATIPAINLARLTPECINARPDPPGLKYKKELGRRDTESELVELGKSDTRNFS